MADQAIPFPPKEKPFKQLQGKKLESVTAKIRAIGQASKDLDTILPMVIEHVIAGGNIALANNLLKALRNPTKKAVADFLKKHIPHEFRENGTFGKKLPEQKAKPKIKAFRAFVASGLLYSQWASKHQRVSTDVDYGKRLDNALKAALTKGNFTQDQIIEHLESVIRSVATDEKKEIAQAVAKAA